MRLKQIEDKFDGKKIKQPFGEDVQSFVVCGEIISFYGYESEVKELLTQLNMNSYGYLVKHRRQLNGFIIPWRPEFAAAIDFGDLCNSWDVQYPANEKELAELPCNKAVNLREIRYKCFRNSGALTAVQFVFSHRFESPLVFDDEKILDREREKLQVIKIDPSRTIRKIAMIVQDD